MFHRIKKYILKRWSFLKNIYVACTHTHIYIFSEYKKWFFLKSRFSQIIQISQVLFMLTYLAKDGEMEVMCGRTRNCPKT